MILHYVRKSFHELLWLNGSSEEDSKRFFIYKSYIESFPYYDSHRTLRVMVETNLILHCQEAFTLKLDFQSPVILEKFFGVRFPLYKHT
jgi:hypothetical protein